MERINVSDSMASAARKINAAFAALHSPIALEEIGENDTMSAIAGKVARNFAKVTTRTMQTIGENDTMQTIASKMLNNFNIVEYEWEERSRSISFLHASDPHGWDTFADDMMDRIDGGNDFAIITGDLKPYNTTVGLESYYNPSDDSGSLKDLKDSGKLFVCTGNHDSNDSWASGQTVHTNHRMKEWMYSLMGNNVVWGDRADASVNEPHYSAYFYKDFQAGRNMLRLIVLDQYEYDAVAGNTDGLANNPVLAYAPTYTSAQLVWLINLLKATPASYHVIIALHQCPFTDNAYADSVRPQPDTEGGTSYVNAPIDLLYVSEKLKSSPYNDQATEMSAALQAAWGNPIADIVKAWLESAHLERTFKNVRVNQADIIIDADFTGLTPAKFCGYMLGHMHCDIGTWLPSAYDENYTQTYESDGVTYQRKLYQKQLSIAVTRAVKTGGVYGDLSSQDDLGGTNGEYRMNKVTIVFATDNSVPQVIVERIGTKLTDGGRNRDKIRFWINDEQTVDIPS